MSISGLPPQKRPFLSLLLPTPSRDQTQKEGFKYTLIEKGNDAVLINREAAGTSRAEYKPVQELGHGKEGSVALFCNQDDCLAVKTYHSGNKKADKLNRILKKTKIPTCENVVPFKLAQIVSDRKKGPSTAVVMPNFCGTLRSKRFQLSVSVASEIVLKIAHALECVSSEGMHYLDIKAENVLISCDGDLVESVALGDIDSIASTPGQANKSLPPHLDDFSYEDDPFGDQPAVQDVQTHLLVRMLMELLRDGGKKAIEAIEGFEREYDRNKLEIGEHEAAIRLMQQTRATAARVLGERDVREFTSEKFQKYLERQKNIHIAFQQMEL